MRRPAIEYVVIGAEKLRASAATVGGLDDILTDGELDRMRRYRRDQDRLGYWAAHVVFRLMAMRWLGITDRRHASALPFDLTCRCCGGAHGKPTIAGAEFSLSRSAETVLVAAGPAGHPIGADIEEVPGVTPTGYHDYALTLRERTLLGDASPAAWLRTWVGKEAVLKVSGLGLAVAPHLVSIEDRSGATETSDARHGTCTGNWSATALAPGVHEADGLQIAYPTAPPNHVVALARREVVPVERTSLTQLPVLGE